MNSPTLGWLRLQADYTCYLGKEATVHLDIVDVPIIGIKARDGRIFLEAVKELRGERIDQPEDPMVAWIGADYTEILTVQLTTEAATAFHPGDPGTPSAVYRMLFPISLQSDLAWAASGNLAGKRHSWEGHYKEEIW